MQAEYSEGSEQGETRVRGQQGRRGQSLTSVLQIKQKSRQSGSDRRGPAPSSRNDVQLLPAESAANKEHHICLNTACSLPASLPPHLSWKRARARRSAHIQSVGSLQTVGKSLVLTHFHNILCTLAYGETRRQGRQTDRQAWKRAQWESLQIDVDAQELLRDLEGQQRGGKRSGAQVR